MLEMGQIPTDQRQINQVEGDLHYQIQVETRVRILIEIRPESQVSYFMEFVRAQWWSFWISCH